MTFLEHLEVLRWHLIRSGIVLIVLAAVAFIGKNYLFDKIVLALAFEDFWTYQKFCGLSHSLGLGDKLCIGQIPLNISNFTMAGQFSMHIWVSIIAAIVVGFPYLLFEMWRFISPGLHKKERKSARGVVFWGSLLFAMGVLFGYYLISPLSVQFLGNYSVSTIVENKISITSFITTIATITLASGIIFELPLAIFFLTKLGIVTPRILKVYRRHAIVGVLILSAIITPPDISSQLLVSLPLVVLYEISIYISKWVENRTNKE